MKCPKCAYLGFETGTRCRNCGYDFSLMLPAADEIDADLRLRPDWDDSALPLFAPAGADDEPLIKVPSAPRPPLSVRRTPEIARPKPVSTPPRAPEVDPRLDFAASGSRQAGPRAEVAFDAPPRSSPVPDASGAWRRLSAAVVDHAILVAVDAGVVYLTLRIADLPMSGWRELPPLPMVAFLALLKLAYFVAFTSVGGQTIGKMLARIRVVTADDDTLDAARAVRRSLAGLLSMATLGIGFVPALVAADRRALHDRLAATRVVVLRSR